jgi:hypothetical protein
MTAKRFSPPEMNRSCGKQLADRKHHFLLDDALVKLKEGATSLEEVKCIAGGIRSRPRSQRA